MITGLEISLMVQKFALLTTKADSPIKSAGSVHIVYLTKQHTLCLRLPQLLV